MKRKKGVFLLVDALFALTLVLTLSLTIVVFSQSPEPQLLQLHQLGRDALVVKQKQGVNFDFGGLTGFNSTSRFAVGSKLVAYPRLCSNPPIPSCFSSQDVFDSLGARKPIVFNSTVSP